MAKCAHLLLVLLVAILGTAPSLRGAGDFHIQLTPGPGLAANPDALAAFQRAAAEWEVWISSPVTIYLDAELSANSTGGSPFDPNTIGETSYGTYENYADLNLNYGTVYTALAGRALEPGFSILASLPPPGTLTAETPVGASLDGTTVGVLRANQRALGLLSGTDTRADGAIRFNSAYTFDYDRFDADGVAPGTTDFQTVAAHEIGHALGFASDVDDFDSSPTLTSDNLTTLDLFRFPTEHRPTNALEFMTFARVLAPGRESVFSDTQVAFSMSTGVQFGDGNQASHWKDDFLFQNGQITVSTLIGIMDPTLSSGTYEEVGSADIRAMGLIGYAIVPEPGSMGLIVSGLLVFCFRAHLRKPYRQKG